MRCSVLALLAVLGIVATPASAQLAAEQNGVDIERMFAPFGFSDIEITSRQIDRIEAEACRNGERVRATLQLLSGKVRIGDRLGECVEENGVARRTASGGRPPPRDAKDVAMRALERVGYTGVQIRRWRDGEWRGTACRDGMLREVRVTNGNVPAAPLRAMRDCPEGRGEAREIVASPNPASVPDEPIDQVSDVKARLERRAYTDVGRIEIKDGLFHGEGCQRGWRFVISMNQDGEILGRRNMGERCDDNALSSVERRGRITPADG